ncbi:MAG TPA: FliH/SctL family protein [Bacillota bacterium]|nr:FliH/SctL family protein [Bacillota bacterium]
MSNTRIFKANGVREAQHCRVEPPEPRLFFIPETESDLQDDAGTASDEAEELAYEVRAELLLEHARKEATELHENAKQAALEITENAKKEALSILENAKREGYQAGYNAGTAQANQEMETQRNEIEALRTLAEEDYRKRVWESEDEILKLALEIAGAITRTTLSTQPETWIQMVREAIAKVAGAHELLIRVAPQDEVILTENITAIREVLTESAPIRWEADPTLKPGDLWVETNIGQIDARISQQLQAVWTALRTGAEEHE